MIRRLVLPDSAAIKAGSSELSAPSACRNLEPILDILLPRLPRSGDVVEIASGTGQHISALAAHRPDLAFHPSDPDPVRRASIDARCRGLRNVALARDIDACHPGWAVGASSDAIIVINLLHLSADGERAVLLDEAQRALAPGGLLAIYGPFLRDGVATSAGDVKFDTDLRAQDDQIGFKDVGLVTTVLKALSLRVETVGMPANNMMLLARAPASTGVL